MLPFYDRSVIEHLTSINNIDAITIVYNKSDGCSKDLQLKYRALFGKKPIQLEFINPLFSVDSYECNHSNSCPFIKAAQPNY